MDPASPAKLLAKALKLLSYRPRSIFEIKSKLSRFTSSPHQLDHVINKLISANLLNDQDFARWWIDQRCQFKPKGNLAIKQELLQKGISLDLIENLAFSSQTEVQLARKALLSKSGLSLDKAYRFLQSRGFSSQAISLVIDDHFNSE